MTEPGRDYHAEAQTVWPSYQPDQRPIRDVQIETLNRALNDEVLRHARTRVLNLVLLNLLGSGIEHKVVEHIADDINQKEVVVIRKRAFSEREARRHARTAQLNVLLLGMFRTQQRDHAQQINLLLRLLRGQSVLRVKPKKKREQVRQTPSMRSGIPATISERTGLAAQIQEPITLRSGIVIDPGRRAVRAHDGAAFALLTDAPWLALCELARQNDWTTADDINQSVFGGRSKGSGIRSAILRARKAIVYVGGKASDIENKPGYGGWRLQFTRDAQP